MNIRAIITRAVATAVQSTMGMLLASGLTDLSPETGQTALVAGAAAGLSVIYNALNQYLSSVEG